MKIPGDDSSDSAAKVSLRSLVNTKTAAPQNAQSQSSVDQTADDSSPKTDSVKVSSLAQSIRNELDPEKMKVERQAHVDRIKKLVQEGKYASSSHDVAKSFALEVLTESALLSGDTSDDAIL